METPEGAQRSLVRLISNKRGNSYEERLKNAGLTTLRDRRIRAHMIETYKVMNGFTKVDIRMNGLSSEARMKQGAQEQPQAYQTTGESK